MHKVLSRALCATTALAGGLLVSSVAMAQSSGTTAVEELVVTGSRGPADIGGVIVAEVEPKSRATIDSAFIARQMPGQTILGSLNLMPGVNFSNNDAYGSAGGDITIRGFDSQRIALVWDGVPLNDSGNYAIYPNQQLEPDLIDSATVNLGTTDVDSPTAAAAGGTINYVTRRAADEFGVRAEVGIGSDNFQRYYGTLETGQFGPFGTKAWISGLYTKNDIFTPKNAIADAPGKIEKWQINGRIDQEIGSIGEISVIANYNENRNNFINRVTLAQFNQRKLPVYNATCIPALPAAGPGAQTDVCPSFVGHNLNPSNTGNLRALSKWNLSDTLTLTVDPSFQYTLANGGGAQVFPETDLQLRGNSGAAGVDLNGDGDILDRVFLYRPNTTNTRRYGVTSSLIWKFADNQNVRLAYTFDRAKHRQTGDVGYVDRLTGDPENVFGGKDGEGRVVALPDGTNLRRRDRLSVAILNQVAAEYRGRFMEDKLLVNVGVRAPFFKRELNNFCYQQNTFNAYCTTQTGTPVPGTDDGTGRPLVTFPQATLNSSASLQYGAPRRWDVKFDDVLPNVGVSYDFTDALSVYASYAETLSAPRTDDLYDQKLTQVDPEKNKAVDLGVRYQTPQLLVSAAIWHADFSNRIERTFDEQAGIAFSTNVGDVKLQGFDAQVGWEPTEYLSAYASFSYVDSEIQNDIPGGSAGAPPIKTAGKSLYETPKTQGAVRVTYDPIEALSLGVQGKFVGDRWSNLTNTEKFPGYTLWDLDARWKLDSFGMENTYIQANVSNLFDERYLGDMVVNLDTNGQAQPGYRRTFTLTLHAEF